MNAVTPLRPAEAAGDSVLQPALRDCVARAVRRYLVDLDGKPGDYQPAHQVIAHMAAELGIPGGIVVVALLVVLGLRLLKGGSWTVMVGAPTFSLAMLGTIPYVPFTTLAMSGVWLGLVRASMAPVTASASDGELPDDGALATPASTPTPA